MLVTVASGDQETRAELGDVLPPQLQCSAEMMSN
jgi:hypothetical protein